jgi:LPS-assembly lipoprotein
MKKIILVLSVLLISACGYHLRQSGQISAQYPSIYLDISNQSLLKVSLSNVLVSSGVKLVDSDIEDKSKLKIVKDSLVKHIQSIGANNRVQEYRLEYDVEYSLDDGDVKSAHLEKDYSFDDQQIAGSQQEEVMLRKQLAEDMAWAIVRQITQATK